VRDHAITGGARPTELKSGKDQPLVAYKLAKR
jgi:hypothetical protein